jgi:hypothetical protein
MRSFAVQLLYRYQNELIFRGVCGARQIVSHRKFFGAIQRGDPDDSGSYQLTMLLKSFSIMAMLHHSRLAYRAQDS